MHDDDESFDLIEALRAPADPLPDATLGGYMARHERPVALEGADGEAYTVDIEIEELGDGTGFASFLVFVRWAATGGGIMDHRESDDIVVAPTEQAARDAAQALPLERVKELLDDAIRRRRDDEEGLEED
ncbi:MAG TPA: hypothetical protein VMN78_12295 [Longimicrobiales bacterium]|nr:hypothetical protein [Longimicrobiales bacterium]